VNFIDILRKIESIKKADNLTNVYSSVELGENSPQATEPSPEHGKPVVSFTPNEHSNKSV